MSSTVYHAQTSPSDYQQSTMYVPVSGLYYQPDSQQGSDDNRDGIATTIGSGVGQMLVEQQDGTLLLYMDDEGRAVTQVSGLSAMEEDGHLSSHVDVRFCKQEMDFLHENYESVEGASMPRSVIFNQYRRYCRQHLGGMIPMNPASFGKLIRLVFAGIKTRRLGTRGNSKYHYYGIRLKPTSVLTQSLQEDCDDTKLGYDEEDDDEESDTHQAVLGHEGSNVVSEEREGPTALQLQHQQFLGDASMVMLDFGSVSIDDNELLPEGITVEHLSTFESLYHTHCQELLEAVKTMQLAAIPVLWQQFWICPITVDGSEDEETVNSNIMRDLCHVESLQKYVRQADYAFYSILIDILMPDVLRPMPNSLTLVLRNFAKNLERWLDLSMADVAKEMIEAKKAAACAFAQLLRRYTGLNHLAQAARTVLQNRAQVNRMADDLSKVDFVHIQEQASWVSQCDDTLVYQLQNDVKRIFHSHFTIEQCASWLDDITTLILQEHIGGEKFSRAARRLIMTWSFYSSLVLRDLTLRSAASFGAFHLIRLMFDEYLTYTIEHKVAAATGVSSVATFGNIKQFIDYSSVPPLETFGDQSNGFNVDYTDDYTLNDPSVASDMLAGLNSQTMYIDQSNGQTAMLDLNQSAGIEQS